MIYITKNLNLLKFKPKIIVLERLYLFHMDFSICPTRSKWLLNKHMKHMRSTCTLDKVIKLRVKFQLNKFPTGQLRLHKKKVK